MVKILILWVENTTGLDFPQLQWMSVVLAIVSAIAVWIGRYWGLREVLREINNFKRRVDDENIVIERLVFEDQADGSIIFDRETEGGLRRLREVFGSDGLVEAIRAAIRKIGPDGKIFPPGPNHRLMMERVDAFITGNDRAASQSAMFGRREEYHLDPTAFTVLYMLGEDGFSMVHVILMNPADLVKIRDERSWQRLVKPRRQSYAKYFDLLPRLSKAFEESAILFQKIADEDKAGEQAPFWKAIIRTRNYSNR